VSAAGNIFSNAGVAAVYLTHGTFCGNDALGVFTELERWAPRLTASLRRGGKRLFDVIVGETGNYLPSYAARMEKGLNAGIEGRESRISVRLFYWSSQNHHIGRADAAVRLIDELARLADSLLASSPPRGGREEEAAARFTPLPQPLSIEERGADRSRVLLWSHSHGGNAFALLTNLLGADAAARAEFFEAGKYFFRSPWTREADVPVWQRVERILSEPDHPVRRLKLDLVTFGTPIRYGWDTAGYSKLLHVVNHRRIRGRAKHLGPRRLRLCRMLRADEGDYVQQLGIAGSNLPPLPVAMRTFVADRRMRRLVERGLEPEGLLARISRGMRVPAEGTTLLVRYADPACAPWRHLFGHAAYTRSRWLPLHCELAAKSFYSRSIRTV
jgi:hypothetical protein